MILYPMLADRLAKSLTHQLAGYFRCCKPRLISLIRSLLPSPNTNCRKKKKTTLSTVGSRAFSVFSPCTWNDFPLPSNGSLLWTSASDLTSEQFLFQNSRTAIYFPLRAAVVLRLKSLFVVLRLKSLFVVLFVVLRQKSLFAVLRLKSLYVVLRLKSLFVVLRLKSLYVVLRLKSLFVVLVGCK